MLAGYDNKQMQEALLPVLRLSEAGNLDLARTSDLVTDSLSSLGKGTKDLPIYLDQVAKTAASSNTNIDALMEGLIVCGGTVKNLNVPLDEANTLLGTLANRGIKGSEAGNSFNSILINLTSGAGQAGEAMKKLGLRAFDSNGKFKGVSKVLLELKDKTKNMTEEQRNMYLSMIGGKTQLTTLQALLSGVGEEYGELNGKIKNSNGALNNMATTMQKNNKGSITQLKSALEELCIKIYDVLKPAIANIVDKLKEWTDKLNNLSPAQQKTIIKIAGMVAAIGPLLLVGGKLASGIGKLYRLFSTVSGAIAVVKTGVAATTPAVGVLAKVFALLNLKIILIAAAIGGLIYVGKKVYNYFTSDCVKSTDLLADKTEQTAKRIQTANGQMVTAYGQTTTKISEGTKKAVGAYMKLDKQASKALMNLNANSVKITKKNKDDLVAQYNQMGQQIKAGYDKHCQDHTKKLQKFFSTNKSLTAKEKAEILAKEKSHNEKMKASTNDYTNKIKAILDKASKQNRKLKANEVKEIEKYQDKMKENAVRSLSANEVESKVILERIKSYSTSITTQQASEVIKNAENQRVKSVDSVNKQFIETKANIEQMRDVTHSITKEQADKMIKEAERQKNENIKKANEQKQAVVKQVSQQNSEVIKNIDTSNGQIKTKWQVLKEDVSKKAHEMKESVVKSFSEKKREITKKCSEIKTSITTKWNEIVNWFSTLPARLKQKAHEMFESMKQGINDKLASIKKSTSDIGESIKSAFNEIPSKMLNIGHDIMNGLKNGLMNKIGEIKEAASNIAGAVSSKVKTALDIHSPSRVMQELGRYTSQGLALGILEDMDKVEKAARLAAQTVKDITSGQLNDVKIKNNTNDKEIKDRVARQLNWGVYNKKEYEQYLNFIDKLNKEEVEKSKEYLKEDYENRVKNIEDRLRILKNENSIELQTEKNRIDSQIVYYQKLQRNTKNKNTKANYADKIASLRQYQNQVLNTTKANQKAQMDSLERSKSALKEYHDNGMELLDKREKEVKGSLKIQENAFKDLMTTYDTAIKQLGIKTGDLIKDLENQEAIIVVQSKKVEDLRKRYEDLAYTFGITASETIKAREQFENTRLELENMSNAVLEANKKISDNINKFQNQIINSLKERYTQELKLEEDKITKELNNLNKWKDESIKRIDDVYNAKIKALDDEIKAEDKAEQDRSELKKINDLKQAINFEHNEFNKVALQKELNKSIAERNKGLHREDIENKKLSLEQKKQNEINNINNLYESNKANLENQLKDTKKFYEEKLIMTNLQAESEKLIISNNQNEIVKLIKTYDKDYENAGKTLGERLADGIKGKISPVLEMIKNIGETINSIRTEEIQAAINTAKYIPTSSIGSSINTSMTTNSKTIVNHNSVTFNSPKALNPSEIRKNTETTLRNIAFGM